jgi:hypothetical protein
MPSHYCFECKVVSKWSDQNYLSNQQSYIDKCLNHKTVNRSRVPKCKQCRAKIHELQKVIKCEACNTFCVWNVSINKWVPINGGIEQCVKTENSEHILYL